MRHVKRLLVTMLVVAMVLSTAGIASAAIDDVVGTKYEEAVQYLYDLGVVDGRPDGFFPEEVITRAEATKVIIVMTYGSSALADLLKGTSPFPDVAGEHWASGYIMLAKNAGIVNGFEDGTFRPNEPVTYAQFAKMLVEAAGLEPVEELGWPGNYVAAAQAAGMLDEDLVPDFVEGAPAIRGDCAIMASFTVAEVEDPETGRTLAQSVFGLSDVAELVITPETVNVAIGESVVFTVKALDADGEELVVVPTFSTTEPGKAAVSTEGSFISSASGAYTVTATADGVTAEATVNVFGKATALRIVPETAEIVANEASKLEITVEVVDEHGFLVANDDSTKVKIGYGTDGNNGAVELPSTVSKTVSDGTATFALTATDWPERTDIIKVSHDVGDPVLTAATCEITSVEQVAGSIKLTAAPTAISANAQTNTTVDAQVLDQAGKAISYGVYNLTWSISGPGTWSSASTADKTRATDTTGQDSLAVYSIQGSPGTITVTVSCEGLEAETIDIESVVAGEPDAIQVEVLDDTLKSGSGTDVIEFCVVLLDDQGRPTVSDAVIEFEVKNDADGVNLGVPDDKLGLDVVKATIPIGATASGVFEINDNGAKIGTHTIRVIDTNKDFAKATFPIVVTAGSVAGFTVSPATTAATVYMDIAGPSAVITVQLKDAAGNNVPEADVEVTCTLNDATPVTTGYAYVNGKKMASETEAVVKTDATGKAVFNVTAQAYDTDQYVFDFSAVVAGSEETGTSAMLEVSDQVAKSVEVSFRNHDNTGTTGGSISRVTADAEIGDPAVANRAYVWARVKDQNGNGIDDQEVKLVFSNDGDNVQDLVIEVGSGAAPLPGADTVTATTLEKGYVIVSFLGAEEGIYSVKATATQVSPSISVERSFRTVAGRDFCGFGVETADGDSVENLELKANTPTELRVFMVDNGGNPIVASTATAENKLYVAPGVADEWEIDFTLDTGGDWELRTTSGGTGVSEVNVSAGQYYKTVYIVTDEDATITGYDIQIVIP